MVQTPPSLEAEVCRELAGSLERMGLIDAGEQPPFTVLAGGVSSLIVYAATSRGPLCVKRALPKLKVTADWFSPVQRNLGEVQWMKLASEIVPQSVPRLLGQDPSSFTFAMEFLSPESYRNWKTELLAGRVDLELAGLTGERIAQIHAFSAGKKECMHLGNDDAIFSSLRLDPYYEAAALAHPQCAPVLRGLIETTLAAKKALIHGDVSPKNILAGTDGPVFLDAETAWYGDPAFDLAFCLTHLLLKSVYRPASAEQYLRAFAVLKNSYLDRVDWEDPPALEARAAALLAGNLLARIDGKSPVEYLTGEGDKGFVRSFAIDALARPHLRLDSMAERWHIRREVEERHHAL